jgi:ABC-2 type transport system ATP-binding protein
MTSTAVQRRKLAVEVRDLRKSYGDVQAVRGVSFEVRRGELRQ